MVFLNQKKNFKNQRPPSTRVVTFCCFMYHDEYLEPNTEHSFQVHNNWDEIPEPPLPPWHPEQNTNSVVLAWLNVAISIFSHIRNGMSQFTHSWQLTAPVDGHES